MTMMMMSHPMMTRTMMMMLRRTRRRRSTQLRPTLSHHLPPPVHRVTARISTRAQTPVSLPLDTEIPSPPLPVSLPVHVSPLLPPVSPTYPLGYRAAIIRLRSETPSTSHPLPPPSPIVLPRTRAFIPMMRVATPSTYILASRSEAPPSGTPPLLPIPLPTPSPPLLLPSTDCRAGVSEVTLLPRKRLCTALGPRYEVGESSSAPTARPTKGFRADYGFIATLDDEIRRDSERYDDRLLMSGRLNTLFRDRRAHAHTALIMEREARLSREAWERSMDASDLARSKVMALRTQVVA
ncbi:hypothetical protein Tco_0700400 [Tanacetum coccineum]